MVSLVVDRPKWFQPETGTGEGGGHLEVSRDESRIGHTGEASRWRVQDGGGDAMSSILTIWVSSEADSVRKKGEAGTARTYELERM